MLKCEFLNVKYDTFSSISVIYLSNFPNGDFKGVHLLQHKQSLNWVQILLIRYSLIVISSYFESIENYSFGGVHCIISCHISLWHPEGRWEVSLRDDITALERVLYSTEVGFSNRHYWMIGHFQVRFQSQSQTLFSCRRSLEFWFGKPTIPLEFDVNIYKMLIGVSGYKLFSQSATSFAT